VRHIGIVTVEPGFATHDYSPLMAGNQLSLGDALEVWSERCRIEGNFSREWARAYDPVSSRLKQRTGPCKEKKAEPLIPPDSTAGVHNPLSQFSPK